MAVHHPPTSLEAKHPFGGILGQDRAVGQLLAAHSRDRLSHALAFVGPAGVGRRTTALRLAAWLLADQSDQTAGRNWQAELRLMQDHAHPDFLALGPDETTAKAEIKVEAARKLVGFMQQTPARSDWRVALVEQAERLNRQAANGILKVLEEPPARASIILVVNDLEQVLPTIRSRVAAVAFERLSADVMGTIAQSQGIALSAAALRASQGSLAIARQLADPKASENLGFLQAAVTGRLSDDKLHGLVAWCCANPDLALGQVLQTLSQAARSSQSHHLADAYFHVLTLDQRRQSYNLDATASWLEVFALLKKCAKAAAGR